VQVNVDVLQPIPELPKRRPPAVSAAVRKAQLTGPARVNPKQVKAP
jgi:hypothetical protein